MQVVLRVLGGKNDGREIAITTPEFIIGRGDNAQLRPTSDLISRNHCAIRLIDRKVVIEDLGSRNGTFVNGEALTGSYEAKAGDNLRVGRLQFEILIDHVKPGNKKPKVADVAEAATRAVQTEKVESIEDSITEWLVGPDDDVEDRIRNTETVQFNLDDTKTLESDPSDTSASSDSSKSDSSDDLGDKKKKKKEFGKLPPMPKFSHDNSTAAAGDVLRKFFNRR